MRSNLKIHTHTESLFYKGISHYQQNQPELANMCWQEALAGTFHPELIAHIHFGLGLIALGDKDFRKAIQLLSDSLAKIRTCIALSTEQSQPLFPIDQLQGIFLKTAYFLSIAQYCVQDWSQANALISMTLDEIKSFQKITFNEGLVSLYINAPLIQYGLWPELRHFAPEHILILLGLTNTHLDHHQAATALFQSLLQSNVTPKLRIRCLYQLGILAYTRTQFARAETYFLEILKDKSPSNPFSSDLIQTAISLTQFYQTADASIISTKMKMPKKFIFNCAYSYSRDMYEIALGLRNIHYKKTEILLFESAYCEPNFYLAHYNLGITQYHLEKYAFALVSFKLSSSYEPTFTMARYFTAMTLDKLGLISEAESLFLQLVATPENFDICYNTGNFFLLEKKWDLAKQLFTQATVFDPTIPDTYLKLAECCIKTNSPKEAERYLQKAEKRDGPSTKLFHLWGCLYFELKAYSLAKQMLRKALEIDYFYLDSARLYTSIFKAMMDQCIWTDRASDLDYIIQLTTAYLDKGLPSPLHPQDANGFIENVTLQGRISERENTIIVNLYKKFIKNTPIKLSVDKTPHRRLRIGFLSGCCNNHIIGVLSCGLFQHFDRNQFEIYTYHYGDVDHSSAYHLIKASSDQFLDVGTWFHHDIIQQIIHDKIDILIETTIHTDHPVYKGEKNRPSLTRFRLAPIQIYYLDFCGNFAHPNIDYMVCNPYITSPAELDYKTPFIYLPCAWGSSFNDLHLPVKKVSKRDFGIPPNAFVFASMNHSYKFEPFIFQLWMSILAKTPKSVLCLGKKQSEEMASNLKQAAKTHGVDPSRLIFLDKIPSEEYLGFYTICDLCLDPYIYNGQSTTLYALWMDCLTLTLIGKTWSRRASASILNYASLSELIAESPEDYVAKACQFAANPTQLTAIKENFRKNNKSKLFDTHLWVKQFEQGLLRAWDNYLQGNPPQNISI